MGRQQNLGEVNQNEVARIKSDLTTIAQGLRVTDDHAGYDAACKRLLSEKAILARIMQGCLDEYKDCDIESVEACIEETPQISSVAVFPDEDISIITGMDTEDKSIQEGTVTYDIRFQAFVPNSDEQIALIINVEAQNKFNPGYPLVKRGIYYCARMISSQHGREFFSSHYEKIKKVYSIWICLKPPKERESTITRYCLTEENLVGEIKEPHAHYDLFSVIMLCLGGRDNIAYDGVIRMLDVLLSRDIAQTKKRDILESDYNIPMTRSMERGMSMTCNLSEGVWEEGFVEGKADSLKNLMEAMSLTLDQAMAILKIPANEKQKYTDLLNQ